MLESTQKVAENQPREYARSVHSNQAIEHARRVHGTNQTYVRSVVKNQSKKYTTSSKELNENACKREERIHKS